MENDNFIPSEKSVIDYVFDGNNKSIINDLTNVINAVISKLEKQKPKEVVWVEVFVSLLSTAFFKDPKEKEAELRDKKEKIAEIDKKINNLNISQNIFNKFFNELNEMLVNSNDLIFNIEKLEYSVDFKEKKFECKKLEIIYDKESMKNIMESINKNFSLIKEIDELNKEIDNSNNFEEKINKINLQNYISFSSHPQLQCLKNQEFCRKYNITLDRNKNIKLNEKNLKLIIILKLFYFYAEKINTNYGDQIFGEENIRETEKRKLVRNKIIFDISTVFFQKCLEFYFVKDKKSFQEHKECLQKEVNLLFEKELKIKDLTNFDNKEIYELKNSFLLQCMNSIKTRQSGQNINANREGNIYSNYIASGNIYNNDDDFRVDGSIKNINIQYIAPQEDSQTAIQENDPQNPPLNKFIYTIGLMTHKLTEMMPKNKPTNERIH